MIPIEAIKDDLYKIYQSYGFNDLVMFNRQLNRLSERKRKPDSIKKEFIQIMDDKLKMLNIK